MNRRKQYKRLIVTKKYIKSLDASFDKAIREMHKQFFEALAEEENEQTGILKVK